MAGIADFFNISKSPVLNYFKSAPVDTSNSQPTAYHQGSGGLYRGRGGGAEKYAGGMAVAYPVVQLNHTQLRMQARAAMQDSVEARAIVESKTNGIAGTGLKFEPTPDISVLGITQEAAAMWGRDTASRFDLFMRDKKQNRSKKMTGYQSQRFWAWSIERDNDVFMRFYYSKDRSLQNPLQFEFIDPDQIRGDAYTTSYGMCSIKDGIGRDEQGCEVSYDIYVKKQNGTIEKVTVQREGSRSKRIFMLHGFSIEYAGQGRGYTKLAPILQECQSLSNYRIAHIEMAINQSVMMGWVKPSETQDAGKIMDDLENYGSTDPNAPQAECAEETIGDMTCHRIPEATVGTPSIFLQNLPAGQDITFGNPNAPGATYDKFVDSFFTNLAALTGEPIEVVQKKFGNSFSASRGTLLLRQVVLLIERADQASDFLNPLVEMWMSGEIAAGRISAPGWSDPRLRAAWLKCSWRGAPVPDIDPKKLADSRRINLETGATNINKEAQEHSGLDADVNIAINNLAFENYEIMPWNKTEPEPDTPDDNSDDGKD